MKTILTLILVGIVAFATAQNNDIRFELSKVYEGGYPAINGVVEKIADAQVIEYGVRWQADFSSEIDIHRNYMFLKTDSELLAFDTYYQLLISPKFVASVRDDFRLNGDESAMLFQELLCLVDQRFWDVFFFQENHDWYFIRKVFFDDIEAWKVTVDNGGKILSIDYSSRMQVTLPDDKEDVKMVDVSGYQSNAAISGEDAKVMQQYIDDKLTFNQEVVSVPEDIITPFSSARVCKLKYSFSETVSDDEYGDYISTSSYEYPVLVDGVEILVFNDINELISSERFKERLNSDFTLSVKGNAFLFETFLDEVTSFDKREKATFSQYNSWFFVREESFGEPAGFRVEVDEKGVPVAIYYSGNLGVKVPEEVFDESTVDWGFSLIDPLQTELKVTEGTVLPFGVVFNDDAASKTGAWLMVSYQGEMVSMYAATEMTSPYYSEVPGEIMTVGKHTVDIYLMRPGMDTETAHGKITLNIEVVPFDDGGMDWSLNMEEPAQNELQSQEGVSIPVRLLFDADEANRLGVNLIIRFNGNDVGGSNAPHLNSPFETQIPGGAMTSGKHIVEFLLVPPGKEKDRVLASAEVNIEVK